MRLCVGFISTVLTNHGQHVIITKCLDLGLKLKPLGNSFRYFGMPGEVLCKMRCGMHLVVNAHHSSSLGL